MSVPTAVKPVSSSSRPSASSPPTVTRPSSSSRPTRNRSSSSHRLPHYGPRGQASALRAFFGFARSRGVSMTFERTTHRLRAVRFTGLYIRTDEADEAEQRSLSLPSITIGNWPPGTWPTACVSPTHKRGRRHACRRPACGAVGEPRWDGSGSTEQFPSLRDQPGSRANHVLPVDPAASSSATFLVVLAPVVQVPHQRSKTAS